MTFHHLALGPGLSSLLDVLLRATVVFAIALALAWLVRKGAATTRHQLWTLTFGLLLALPVLALLGPSWDLPLLPASIDVADAEVGDGAFDRAGSPSVTAPIEPVSAGLGAPARASTSSDAGPVDSVATDAPLSISPSALPLPLFWTLVWALGGGAVLVSVGVGVARFRRLAQSAQPAKDPVWRRQLEAAQDELGFRANVRLLLGGKVAMPMTGGLWRPVILLPASAAGWSAARRRVVLTHELVHIRRRDAQRQLLGRVVLALYWFHPLSWLASRLAAASREEACDEAVLGVGVPPSEYARHLLAIAENESRAGQRLVSPALPIVNASRLEKRIKAIVRPHRRRRGGFVTAVGLTALFVTGVLASCTDPVPVPVVSAGDSTPSGQEAKRRLGVAPFGGRDCPLVSAGAAEGRWRRTHMSEIPPSGSFAALFGREGPLICMAIGGDVVMSHDALEVRAISPGDAIVLESVDRRTHALEITQGPAGLEYDWTIDGQKQAFDAEARRFRDLMLALHRSSGFLRDMETIGLWGETGGRHGPVHVHRAVAAMRGQEASLRHEVARLLGRLAEYRAEELSLESALAAASNRRTRTLLEVEIADRRKRIGGLEERIAAMELSAIEAEIHYQLGSYDSERDARDLAEALKDPVEYLSVQQRTRTREQDALRRLING